MKNYFLFILCILPIALKSQSHSSYGVMGGLDYTFSSRSEISEFGGDVKPKLAYRFGLNYAQKISTKFAIEVGLRYSKYKYDYPGKIYQWGTDHNGEGGFELMLTDLHRSGFSYTHTFIEISFNVKYILKENKLNPYIIMGLSPNIYLRTNTQAEYGGEKLSKNFTSSELKQMTLSVNLGFGIDYPIQNNLVLYAQPTLRYHITDFSTSSISEYLYSGGLELGIRKNLN